MKKALPSGEKYDCLRVKVVLLKWTYNCGALLYKKQQLFHEKVNDLEFFIRMQSIMRHRNRTVHDSIYIILQIH